MVKVGHLLTYKTELAPSSPLCTQESCFSDTKYSKCSGKLLKQNHTSNQQTINTHTHTLAKTELFECKRAGTKSALNQPLPI